MDRVARGVSTVAIEKALERLPGRIRDRLRYTHFLIGCDPIWVGLHGESDEYTPDGRSYRNTGHVSYPHHQGHMPVCDRRSTVVLPSADDLHPSVVVHELGHVLHEVVGWQYSCYPVSLYAQSNFLEAFAEAFTAFVLYGDQKDRDYTQDDPYYRWRLHPEDEVYFRRLS